MTSKPLKEGEKAPHFSLPLAGGGKLSLGSLKGKWVILYFYPKDDTPGCTTEAKDFTALKKAFAKHGAVVVGVSKDSIARHDKFIAKHDLDIQLGADEEGTMVERYGVWIEKSLYGRRYMGIERATFLIDPKGMIRRIWRKVRVKGHAQAVLDSLKAQ